MARRYYSEIILHIIWHPKDSQSLLVGDVVKIAYSDLRERLVGTKSVIIHPFEGFETHRLSRLLVPPDEPIADVPHDLDVEVERA